jgi:glutaredoxin 2
MYSKKDKMPQLILRQFEYESDTWKRLLSFMIDENIHLKNRLVEILKSIPDQSSLEEMENFHSRFIKEDDLINLLRNDVAELDRLLIREVFEDGKIFEDINRKLNKLRNNIVNAELQFSQLKLEFNNYFSEMFNNRDREKYLSNN